MGLSAHVYLYESTDAGAFEAPRCILQNESAAAYLEQQQIIREMASMELGDFASCAATREFFREQLGPGSLMETALYKGGSVIPPSRAADLVREVRELVRVANAKVDGQPKDNYALYDLITLENFQVQIEHLADASRTLNSPIVGL